MEASPIPVEVSKSLKKGQISLEAAPATRDKGVE